MKMNEPRRLGRFIALCALGIALVGCASTPVVIDTTEVDGVILDVSDTAGTIETQTVTVYETVKEIIHDATPEQKAKIEKEFADLRAIEGIDQYRTRRGSVTGGRHGKL